MKEPTTVALERAKQIILGRDREIQWEELDPIAHSIPAAPQIPGSLDVTILGGLPVADVTNPEMYFTLVHKYMPGNEQEVDLDRAIAWLIFGYAQKQRIPDGTCAFGGGTGADGRRSERYTVPSSFLGGLRQSLAGRNRSA